MTCSKCPVETCLLDCFVAFSSTLKCLSLHEDEICFVALILQVGPFWRPSSLSNNQADHFQKGIQGESMLPFIRGQQKLNYNIRNLFVLNERKSAWNVWTQWHRRTNPSFLYEILVSGRMVLRNNFNVWSRTWVMECWMFSRCFTDLLNFVQTMFKD